MRIYSSIPVELCIYSLTKSKVNHLKLLIYLKHISTGRVSNDTTQYKMWANDIEVSSRFVREAIRWMIKEKWITVNSKRNELRITSYFQICRRLKFKCHLAAKFDGDDFSKLRSFCAAAATTYYIRRKNWTDRKRRAVSKMGDTITTRNSNRKGYSTLPVRYLARCLGVSASCANNYKMLAKKNGWLTVKRNVTSIKDNSDKPIACDVFDVFVSNDELNKGRFRRGLKHLKVVDSDLIRSNVICTTKRFKRGEKL